MKMKRRIIGVPLVLGSLIALFAMADAAMATHTVPIGVTVSCTAGAFVRSMRDGERQQHARRTSFVPLV